MRISTCARLAARILAGWTLALAVECARGGDGPEPSAMRPPVDRYVRYSFTLSNTSGEVVPEAELWVCAPLRNAPSQHVLDLAVSQPHEAVADALGNHLLRFVFSNVPPYAVRIVALDASIQLGDVPEREGPDPAAWLAPAPLVEFDHEDFGRLAPVFDGGTPEQTARDIFGWVRAHVRDSGYDATDRGALYALTYHKGDCTEFATLFVALCRRAGIPARAMGGYVVSRNTVLDPAAYHNWAEFHADGRWHIADPLAGIFMDGQETYVATRVLGTSESPLGNFPRFRYLGDGIQVVMGK